MARPDNPVEWWKDPANWRDQRWIAQPDNMTGDWCVTLDRPGTPGDGNVPIAEYMTEDVAQHIADIHNQWLEDVRDVTRF